jgi:hypothetical protein
MQSYNETMCLCYGIVLESNLIHTLKLHASRVMKILKMYLKVNYCEVNKECNLHIAYCTYNPHKLTKKRGQICFLFLKIVLKFSKV